MGTHCDLIVNYLFYIILINPLRSPNSKQNIQVKIIMTYMPKITFLRASCAALAFLVITDVPASTNSVNLSAGTIVQHVVPTAQRDESASYWTLGRMQAAVSALFVDANPVDGDPPELQNSALAHGKTGAES